MERRQKRVILTVSNDLSTDNRVHKMATTLTNAGFRVIVVGRYIPSSNDLPQECYKTKRFHLLCKKGACFYAELNIRLFLYLITHTFDCATANDLDTLPGTFYATKFKRKKLIYDSHEYFTEVPELQDRKCVKKIWETIENHIVPQLQTCITVCNSIAQIYHTKYGIPFTVIRNLPMKRIPMNIEAPIKIPNRHIILYQGCLNKGRGVESMITAMQYLPQTSLLIIGDGDIFQDLEKLTKSLNLTESVIFTGRIRYDEVASYTKLASIGISLEEDMGDNYKYALPNKIFDYIQAHKPIIVSDLPEMKSIVEQYKVGEIVKNRNPKELAKQISDMLHDQTRMKEYTNNCIIAAHELCWETQERTICELYNN